MRKPDLKANLGQFIFPQLFSFPTVFSQAGKQESSKEKVGSFLLTQWLGFWAFTAMAWVQSLVWELRSFKQCTVRLKKRKGKKMIFIYSPVCSGSQLWRTGSSVVTCQLLVGRVNSQWDLVPGTGIETGPPELGAQSLRHWITREIPEKVNEKKRKGGQLQSLGAEKKQ